MGRKVSRVPTNHRQKKFRRYKRNNQKHGSAVEGGGESGSRGVERAHLFVFIRSAKHLQQVMQFPIRPEQLHWICCLYIF